MYRDECVNFTILMAPIIPILEKVGLSLIQASKSESVYLIASVNASKKIAKLDFH